MNLAYTPDLLIEDLQIGSAFEGAYELRVEPSEKRIRAFLGSTAIADSTRVMIMFETARLPVYYFPVEDVRTDLFTAGERTSKSPYKGEVTYWSITAGVRTVKDAAWSYPHPPAGCPDIRAYVAFHHQLVDAWYEEDEQFFGHARNPYHRIEVLDSSRHVRVVIAGRAVAETSRPRLLFETGLPTRYYIPRLDVRLHLLQTSDQRTSCAYKGTTSEYWSAVVDDGSLKEVAWCYRQPSLEAIRIANMVCFFNERVDLYVDGTKRPRPGTPWS